MIRSQSVQSFQSTLKTFRFVVACVPTIRRDSDPPPPNRGIIRHVLGQGGAARVLKP